MTTIEVPVIDQLPADRNVSAFADYLLTKLLRRQAGFLHVDSRDAVGWCIEVERGRHEVVPEQEFGEFRATLARFGKQYMGGQLYGGFSQPRLSQQGVIYDAAIYMGNDQWRGYWLRLYVRAVVR
jgi:hypothetical protein